MSEDGDLIERIRLLRLDAKRRTSMSKYPRMSCDGDAAEYPKLYPPVTLAVLYEAETRLGFSLPTLLRELYLLVGNGGFGPEYGLWGLFSYVATARSG
jgi:hypothetical protein